MRIKRLKGKRSNSSFMAFADVYYPESKYGSDEELHFCKREVSLKAALRRIKKQNYKKGTAIHLFNWYVGYGNVIIYI